MSNKVNEPVQSNKLERMNAYCDNVLMAWIQLQKCLHRIANKKCVNNVIAMDRSWIDFYFNCRETLLQDRSKI